MEIIILYSNVMCLQGIIILIAQSNKIRNEFEKIWIILTFLVGCSTNESNDPIQGKHHKEVAGADLGICSCGGFGWVVGLGSAMQF